MFANAYLDFGINERGFVDAGRDHWQFHESLDGRETRQILAFTRHFITRLETRYLRRYSEIAASDDQDNARNEFAVAPGRPGIYSRTAVCIAIVWETRPWYQPVARTVS